MMGHPKTKAPPVAAGRALKDDEVLVAGTTNPESSNNRAKSQATGMGVIGSWPPSVEA
jgi:hypothetical protein